MRVTKASQAGEETRLGPEELEQINRLARRELTAEEVYAFSVRLCDNEVDRDGERFDCLWASAAFLTTSGRPRARRPGSIARSWCGSRKN